MVPRVESETGAGEENRTLVFIPKAILLEPAYRSGPGVVFYQIDTTCARVIRRIASGDWPKTRKKARRIRSR